MLYIFRETRVNQILVSEYLLRSFEELDPELLKEVLEVRNFRIRLRHLIYVHLKKIDKNR